MALKSIARLALVNEENIKKIIRKIKPVQIN